MPRDSSETKAALLDTAERLFAEHGAFNVTNREITEAAGQRNASAVNYHFGSRDGLLAALFGDRDVPLDVERGRLAALLGDEPSTDELLRALVTPMEHCLDTRSGRDYLRIIAQFVGRFATWDRDDNPTHEHLRTLLRRLEARPEHLPAEIRRERVVAMIMLMTASMAERARLIESGAPLDLDHDRYVDNLVDMLAGVIEAAALDRI